MTAGWLACATLSAAPVRTSGPNLRGVIVQAVWCELQKRGGGWAKQRLLLSTDPTLSAVEVVEAYANRWTVEVVFPQMTKTDLLTTRAGGQGVTDFHIGIRNDHPVDEQQDELAALFEARPGQPPLHPLSERLQ